MRVEESHVIMSGRMENKFRSGRVILFIAATMNTRHFVFTAY